MNWKPNWSQRLILIIYAAGTLIAAASWESTISQAARYLDLGQQPYQPHLAYLAAYISATIAGLIAVSPRK